MGDKITKLSQAIRLGATFRPQCRGTYFKAKYDSALRVTQVSSCTLGAAYEAVSGSPSIGVGADDLVANTLELRFPEASAVMEQVPYLNDVERLTREQIAAKAEEKGL